MVSENVLSVKPGLILPTSEDCEVVLSSESSLPGGGRNTTTSLSKFCGRGLHTELGGIQGAYSLWFLNLSELSELSDLTRE